MSYTNYIDLENVKKILVIKLRNLGDVLLTTPVFFTLKKYMPKVKIDAYVNKQSFDVLDQNPNIDKIFTYDRSVKKLPLRKKILEDLKILKYFSKQNYDLIINLTEGDRGALISLFSKAKYKVGFDPENKGFLFKKKIYSHIVKNLKNPRHTVEKNLDALRKIGVFPKIEDKKLFFNIDETTLNNVTNLLSENNIDPNNFILIHPTSRWRFKCWNKFDKLIDILKRNGENIVISASNEKFEKDIVKKIIQDHDVLDLSGKTSIKELGALIKLSKNFISVDTLSFHIASALKKKCVVLFGPTSDVIWGPWDNPLAKVIKLDYSCRPCFMDGCGGSKHSDCLANIPVDQVLDAMK